MNIPTGPLGATEYFIDFKRMFKFKWAVTIQKGNQSMFCNE